MSGAHSSQSQLFSIKMRASQGADAHRTHVSGAERIAPAESVPELARLLAMRALEHEKAHPDAINIKIEAIDAPIVRVPALPARAIACDSPAEGLALAARLLADTGLARTGEILDLLPQAANMRGAMLVHADTLLRLDTAVSEPERGVRATRMDEIWTGERACLHKDHYREALILATKVAHAPGLVAEICVSDDPDYVTGYVASRELGYVRLQCMKERGDTRGGRIFLFRGGEPSETVRFLEHTPVLVENIPPAPSFVPAAEALAAVAQRHEVLPA